MNNNTSSNKHICNSFSVNMIKSFPVNITIKEININHAKKLMKNGGYFSAVGHQSTAELLSTILEVPIKTNRITLALDRNDEILLAQYYGERLPEGATILPEGSTIRWFLVKIL
jgi:hypothetical protein